MLPYHCVGMIDVFLLYFVSTVFNLMFIISLLGGFKTAGLSHTVFWYILLGEMGKELSNAMFTTFLFFNFRIINLGIDYVFTKLSGPCSAKLAQMWRDCSLLSLSF